jgi:hypothetical protein
MFNRFITKAKQAFFTAKPPASGYSMMAMQKKYPHVISEQQRADILAAVSASENYIMSFFNAADVKAKPVSRAEELLKKYPNKVDTKELDKSLEDQINNRKFSKY